MYADLTIKNKSLLKRFSHKARFRIALELTNLTSEDQILDFGTGDGYMLLLIRSVNDKLKLVGYEPNTSMFEELKGSVNIKSVELTNSLNGYAGKFNKICCLEVLEHFTRANQAKEIKNMMSLLTDDGKIIISVPIEVGFSSLLKNLVRLLLGQAHSHTNFRSILYSLFGIYLDRGNESYIHSHIGFYYHDLERLILSLGLKIHIKKFSPVPILPGWLNSQVFFVLSKDK